MSETGLVVLLLVLGLGGIIARRLWFKDWWSVLYASMLLVGALNLVDHFFITASVIWGANIVYGMYRRVKG
jgi:hypothetical protein